MDSDFVVGINKSIDAAKGETGQTYPAYLHNTLVTKKLDELAEAITEGGGGASSVEDLEDVEINNPQGGQCFKYNAETGKWTNGDDAGNVQSDWNENDPSSGAYILNKPTIPAAQVQSDWNESDTTDPSFIKNKPSVPNSYIELTQAEYDALTPAEKMSDTPYLITDANGDGSQFQPVIYSTSEREIGVWTDGSPVYEKTFTGLSLSAGTSWTDTGILMADYSIDKLISCEARDARQSFPAAVGTWENDTRIAVYLFVPNRTINSLIIRYTKTTDTAGSGTWTPQGVPAVHYSTDEQVVGTWIDGSPVYEKTISLDNISGTSYSTSALGLNISKVVSFFAYIHLGSDGGYGWMTTPHTEYAQRTYRLDCHYQSGDDKIYITSDWGLSGAIFVMRYTKSST